MLKIRRTSGRDVVFAVSGRMNAGNLNELRRLFESEEKNHRIVFDLKDLTLVDQDAVHFLDGCETHRIKLKNCPAYIREWISRNRRHQTKDEGSTA